MRVSVFFLVILLSSVAFADNGIGGRGGLGTPPGFIQDDSKTNSGKFTKLIVDDGQLYMDGPHAHITTSAGPVMTATYLRLDCDNSPLTPLAGNTIDFTYHDFLPTLAPGLLVVPSIEMVNSNGIGFPTHFGGMGGGLFCYTNDDMPGTLGLIHDFESDQYAIMSYNSAYSSLDCQINGSDAYFSFYNATFSGEDYPVFSGVDSLGNTSLLIDSNITLWDSAGSGQVSCYGVDQAGTTFSAIFVWDSLTATFKYLGAGGMEICPAGTGGSATALSLVYRLLGDGANGDTLRQEFVHRSDLGLLGTGYVAGYIDCVQDDKTGGSEDSHFAFGGYTAGASYEWLRLSGSGTVINDSGLDSDLRVEGDNDSNLLVCDAGTDRVGIGYLSPRAKLEVNNGSFSATSDYANLYTTGTKTSGASDYNARIWGKRSDITYNQAGGEIGYLYGYQDTITHTDGTIGAVGNERDLTGLYEFLDLNGGTVTKDVYGYRMQIDQEAAHTVTGNIYGQSIEVDADGAFGAVYMLRLKEYSGIDYGIYQDGSAPNYFGGMLESPLGCSFGLDTTIGSGTRYWAFSEVDFGAPFNGVPIMQATGDFLFGSTVGAIADGLVVYDISNMGFPTLAFVGNGLSYAATIAVDVDNSIFTVDADWNPVDDVTYDLGSASLRWRKLYVEDSLHSGSATFGDDGTYINQAEDGSLGLYADQGTAQNGIVATIGGMTDDDSVQNGLAIYPTVSQSDTAGYIGLYLSVTENSLGSGIHYLTQMAIGGISKFDIDRTGFATFASGISLGDGRAGYDPYILFYGEDSSGQITWKEDEDYFEFLDDVVISSGESIYLRDTDISITSANDGYLDLEADTGIRLTGPSTRVTGDLYVGNNIDADPAIVFDGDTSDGQITWDEDNDQFAFPDFVTFTGDGVFYQEKTFTFNFAEITGQGKPTLVSRGNFFGFSLPVYNNDNEELYACRCMGSNWDGTSDPVIYVGGWLDTANNAKKFKLQVSVETCDMDGNDVIPNTTNDYPVETTTGNWAQYTSFKASVTIDASAIGLAPGQPLAIRIRRIAASSDEIAGEVVVEGATIQYVADKLGGET